MDAHLLELTGNQAGAVIPTTKFGYFLRAADGEKFVTNPEIFAGSVVAASFTPTASLSPCQARGNGTLYVFDITSGEGHFDDGMGNPVRGLDIGAGLPTDPTMTIGVGGKNNRVIISKSGADIESLDADDLNILGGLLYWREN